MCQMFTFVTCLNFTHICNLVNVQKKKLTSKAHDYVLETKKKT